MATVFVTGSNQGIGLELVRQYSQARFNVFASYCPTYPMEQLLELSQQSPLINLVPVDVRSEEQISSLALQLKQEKIDIFINNAGVFGHEQSLQTISMEEMIEVFRVNALGALFMSKHFLHHVAGSSLKTIVAITSRMGSVSYILQHHDLKPLYAYRTAKAALNMIMASIAIDSYELGIKTLLIHPGHVATAMGCKTEGPMIDVSTSVTGIMRVIEEKPRSLEQFFYQYDGSPMHW